MHYEPIKLRKSKKVGEAAAALGVCVGGGRESN